MTDPSALDSEDLSLLALGTALLRNRWRMARWMVLGAVVAAAIVWRKQPMYTASSSFLPQGTDASRQGLANLAGQFGVALPVSSSASLSPDFYVQILRSRVLLGGLTRDTFTVDEMQGKRVAFADLFGAPPGSAAVREESGVEKLREMASASVQKSTGIVDVTVTTQWPSVSLAITRALVDGVNDFNQRSRQSQASAERKFVEGLLSDATTELHAAEQRLKEFMVNNRVIDRAPELLMESQRLQRDIQIRQQVYTALRTTYEDARIREVRDTPVITVVEPPTARTAPDPRGRLKTVFMGLLFGGGIGALLVLLSNALAPTGSPADGTPERNDFVAALADVRADLRSPLRWLRKLVRA